jgi:hypothetical protein
MVKRGLQMRAHASEGQAQHGLFLLDFVLVSPLVATYPLVTKILRAVRTLADHLAELF